MVDGFTFRKATKEEIARSGQQIDYAFNEEGGEAFSVQYVAHDGNALEHYFQHHAPALRRDHTERFGKHTAAFRTILSILDEGSSAP